MVPGPEGASGAEPAGDTGETPEALEERVAAAQAEIEQLRDRYLRSVAEFDNYRKRMAREREQQGARIKIDMLRQLLPVADDFSLALNHVPAGEREQPWVQGLTLIEHKLRTYLDNLGVAPIEAMGQPFDPQYHDALTTGPSDVHEEGVVSEEIRKGYMLGDQVVRPTLVKVSTGPDRDQAPTA
jgi:molecular chaperone GrpE